MNLAQHVTRSEPRFAPTLLASVARVQSRLAGPLSERSRGAALATRMASTPNGEPIGEVGGNALVAGRRSRGPSLHAIDSEPAPTSCGPRPCPLHKPGPSSLAVLSPPSGLAVCALGRLASSTDSLTRDRRLRYQKSACRDARPERVACLESDADRPPICPPPGEGAGAATADRPRQPSSARAPLRVRSRRVRAPPTPLRRALSSHWTTLHGRSLERAGARDQPFMCLAATRVRAFR